jgi:hypothetical protein
MSTTTTDGIEPQEKAVRFWNYRGNVGCGQPGHVPERGTDSWNWERWKKITPREMAEFARELGHPPACEVCAAEARDRASEGARGLREKHARERGVPVRLSELIARLHELADEHGDPEVMAAYQENSPLAGTIEGVVRIDFGQEEDIKPFVWIVVGGLPHGMTSYGAQAAFHELRGS